MKKSMVVVLVSLVVLSAYGIKIKIDKNDMKAVLKAGEMKQKYNEKKTVFTPISEIPEEYTPGKALMNGDVVRSISVSGNFDKLNRFFENVEAKNADFIRIVFTTDEGDPIIQDLNFDGTVIHYAFDNTRDAFGGEKGIHTRDYDHFICRNSSDGSDEYVLVKDGSSEQHVISLPKGSIK